MVIQKNENELRNAKGSRLIHALTRWRRARQRTGVFLALSNGRYARFFFFSAQRFFIASESRLLPAGVSPPRFG